MAAGLKHQTSLTDPLKPTQRTEPSEGTKPICATDPDGSSCWMPAFGFVILGVNGAAAVYHSRDDPWAVAFVLSSFAILLSLFRALRVFEKLPRESPRRAHAKAAVWVLSTLLTLMFSIRVAALMPFPAAVVVWVMAGSTISAGFYMFFLCPDVVTVSTSEDVPRQASQDHLRLPVHPGP